MWLYCANTRKVFYALMGFSLIPIAPFAFHGLIRLEHNSIFHLTCPIFMNSLGT